MFYVKEVINAYFTILSYIRYSLLLKIRNDLSDMSDEELRQAIYELEDTTMLRLGQMSREELEKEYDGIEVDMDE